MTLAKVCNGFSLNASFFIPQAIPLAERYLPVDIGNFTDYCPLFEYRCPVFRASEELLTQLGKL